MKKCWASSIGNCSSKISGEHIISKSVFLNDIIDVMGFDWCKHEPKKIGLASVTKKILCTTHNSKLSILDSEAKYWFDQMREVDRIFAVRKGISAKTPTVVKYQVNGYLIERWLLKTLINLTAKGTEPIGSDSEEFGKPSRKLVGIVFGMEKFTGHSGLYFIANVGQGIHTGERIKFSALYNDKKYVAGGFFDIRGYTFLLLLDDIHIEKFRKNLFFDGIDYSKAEMNRRIENIRLENKYGYLSQKFTFEWKD